METNFCCMNHVKVMNLCLIYVQLYFFVQNFVIKLSQMSIVLNVQVPLNVARPRGVTSREGAWQKISSPWDNDRFCTTNPSSINCWSASFVMATMSHDKLEAWMESRVWLIMLNTACVVLVIWREKQRKGAKSKHFKKISIWASSWGSWSYEIFKYTCTYTWRMYWTEGFMFNDFGTWLWPSTCIPLDFSVYHLRVQYL